MSREQYETFVLDEALNLARTAPTWRAYLECLERQLSWRMGLVR